MTEMNHPVTFSMLVKKCRQIMVPQIQRDYAQGRETEQEVRESFLQALHGALTLPVGDPALPLNLDFVYGSMEGKDDQAFLPLDGQQRLTTLFLLHWYLAWRDGQLSAFQSLVWGGKHSRFLYAVRPSSTEFFDELVQYVPEEDPDAGLSVKRLIEDQPWFFLYWRLDPTIQSALTMLDAMHARFNATAGLYARLVDDKQPAITFQLLQLEHFGLSDDLYIKMNARGKPLTAFETFKARFEEELKQLFPTERRTLGKGKVPVPQFFAMRIDTQWTDFFWSYKEPASNTFDDAVMNLFWAVARVSLDPEDASFADQTSMLRNKSVEATYTSFHEHGWLTRTFAENVICLLEAWSAGGGKLTPQLPSSRFFDERAFFQRAIKTPAALEYTDLVQFAAYTSFLKRNEGSVKPAEFQEWARVIFNLSVNSAIERPEEFGRALAGIQTIVPHSRQILTHLASMEIQPVGFSPQQVREEVLKAQLIGAHSGWRGRIDAAEQHGYFRGQIEFLLDFSGVRAKAAQSVGEWSQAQHATLQKSFDDYWKKAQATFTGGGLANTSRHPHLWQRALLAVGDYLGYLGRNHSFLTDHPSNWDSWKRLLRGSTPGDALRRQHLKTLWDRLDATTDVAPQLEAVIAGVGQVEPWRWVTVKCPQVIQYCEKGEIRRNDSVPEIYLLKKQKMSGAHAELFSYVLYHELRDPAAAASLAPLKVEYYNDVSGTDSEPCVVLSCELPKCRLQFAVLSIKGQFQISVTEAAGKNLPQAITALRSQGFTGTDQNLTRLFTRRDVRKVLQTTAAALAVQPDASSA